MSVNNNPSSSTQMASSSQGIRDKITAFLNTRTTDEFIRGEANFWDRRGQLMSIRDDLDFLRFEDEPLYQEMLLSHIRDHHLPALEELARQMTSPEDFQAMKSLNDRSFRVLTIDESGHFTLDEDPTALYNFHYLKRIHCLLSSLKLLDTSSIEQIGERLDLLPRLHSFYAHNQSFQHSLLRAIYSIWTDSAKEYLETTEGRSLIHLPLEELMNFHTHTLAALSLHSFFDHDETWAIDQLTYFYLLTQHTIELKIADKLLPLSGLELDDLNAMHLDLYSDTFEVALKETSIRRIMTYYVRHNYNREHREPDLTDERFEEIFRHPAIKKSIRAFCTSLIEDLKPAIVNQIKKREKVHVSLEPEVMAKEFDQAVPDLFEEIASHIEEQSLFEAPSYSASSSSSSSSADLPDLPPHYSDRDTSSPDSLSS